MCSISCCTVIHFRINLLFIISVQLCDLLFILTYMYLKLVLPRVYKQQEYTTPYVAL